MDKISALIDGELDEHEDRQLSMVMRQTSFGNAGTCFT